MSVDWSDLRPRVLSGAVMLVIGAVEVWLGGMPFALLVVALTGGMMWELARMTAEPERDLSLWLGALAAGEFACHRNRLPRTVTAGQIAFDIQVLRAFERGKSDLIG